MNGGVQKFRDACTMPPLYRLTPIPYAYFHSMAVLLHAFHFTLTVYLSTAFAAIAVVRQNRDLRRDYHNATTLLNAADAIVRPDSNILVDIIFSVVSELLVLLITTRIVKSSSC